MSTVKGNRLNVSRMTKHVTNSCQLQVNTCCPRQLSQWIKLTLLLLKYPTLRILIAMPRASRADLIMEMARSGEAPPREWTKVELSARLDELRAEVGQGPFNNKKEKTPLRRMVIALNEAAKKKSTLVNLHNSSAKCPCLTTRQLQPSRRHAS